MLLKIYRSVAISSPRSSILSKLTTARMSTEAPSKNSGKSRRRSVRPSAHPTPAKKEAKRLEKEAKLAAKQVKQTTSTPAVEKKAKIDKEKKAGEPAFVNTTPKGEKKGTLLIVALLCV